MGLQIMICLPAESITRMSHHLSCFSNSYLNHIIRMYFSTDLSSAHHHGRESRHWASQCCACALLCTSLMQTTDVAFVAVVHVGMQNLITELRRHGGYVSKDIVIGRDRCVPVIAMAISENLGETLTMQASTHELA